MPANKNEIELQDVSTHLEYIQLLQHADKFKLNKDFVNAIDKYAQAMHMGDVFYPMKQIAMIQEELGLVEDALVTAQALIEQNKADSSIYQLRNRILEQTGMQTCEIEQVSQDHWVNRSTVSKYLRQARECARKGEYKQGIKVLLMALCENPSEAHYLQKEIDALVEKL